MLRRRKTLLTLALITPLLAGCSGEHIKVNFIDMQSIGTLDYDTVSTKLDEADYAWENENYPKIKATIAANCTLNAAYSQRENGTVYATNSPSYQATATMYGMTSDLHDKSTLQYDTNYTKKIGEILTDAAPPAAIVKNINQQTVDKANKYFMEKGADEWARKYHESLEYTVYTDSGLKKQGPMSYDDLMNHLSEQPVKELTSPYSDVPESNRQYLKQVTCNQ